MKAWRLELELSKRRKGSYLLPINVMLGLFESKPKFLYSRHPALSIIEESPYTIRPQNKTGQFDSRIV